MSNEPQQIFKYLRRLFELVNILEDHFRDIKAVVDVLSWIASRADKAIDKLEEQPAIDDVLRELSEYLTGNIDRIDRMLLLILEKMPEGRPSERVRRETAELAQETLHNRMRSLRFQLQRHTTNLNDLEDQASLYGMAIPLEINNQIDWERKKIESIETEIGYIKSQLD